ncbi:hypothetical protein OSB04_018647 [Centaurea solstitialis]|uniref:Uncharacterized protein n=1 Tax=Centaurea solstitialis TaxID=347529 RepID=A0AA38WAP9_9ASTR|nr:hypothetical protein OSB04_018647 [Centaurea solstitialis]
MRNESSRVVYILRFIEEHLMVEFSHDTISFFVAGSKLKVELVPRRMMVMIHRKGERYNTRIGIDGLRRWLKTEIQRMLVGFPRFGIKGPFGSRNWMEFEGIGMANSIDQIPCYYLVRGMKAKESFEFLQIP